MHGILFGISNLPTGTGPIQSVIIYSTIDQELITFLYLLPTTGADMITRFARPYSFRGSIFGCCPIFFVGIYSRSASSRM